MNDPNVGYDFSDVLFDINPTKLCIKCHKSFDFISAIDFLICNQCVRLEYQTEQEFMEDYGYVIKNTK